MEVDILVYIVPRQLDSQSQVHRTIRSMLVAAKVSAYYLVCSGLF